MATNDQYVLITKGALDELRRIVRKVDSISGDGVVNSPTSITILGSRGAKGLAERSRKTFPAKITGESGDGYEWEEVYSPDADGENETLEGGRNSDAGLAYEWNGVTVAEDTVVEMTELPGPYYAFVAPQQEATFRLARLTSYSSGTFSGKLLTYAAGEFSETGETLTDIEEANGAYGHRTHATSGQVVTLVGENVFASSLRLKNNSTEVGQTGGLQMHSSLTSVIAFALGSSGEPATISLQGSPADYKVLQAQGGNLVFDWVRGH